MRILIKYIMHLNLNTLENMATFSDESSRKESGTAHITNKALDNMRYEGLRLPYATNEQHASYDNGRIMNKGSSGIRSFWESHVSRGQSEKKEKERQSSMKPYSFPRWRSTDALSASLVASKNVEVPTDSIIPEQRLQKMRESERIAQINKKYIHQQAELTRPMRKGKSLDSLVVQMNENPWYDRKKIRESICIQSIGNTAETRKRFESSKLEESMAQFSFQDLSFLRIHRELEGRQKNTHSTKWPLKTVIW
ncbi:hypothetical protein DICVIV_03309 [Dictyocaulus viviparus]|uniref:Uncharacterized protein n=1 Tax=Dictyocaulus viviparus TaxID=29172 RepID=A0A0D8Y3E1_DICVI|nr:hypothetical protein DICVIV_03309 [Dictyocaulus viviparus]